MRLRLSPLAAAAMLDLSAKVYSTTCCGAKIFKANNVKVARVLSELNIWPTFPYWRVTVDDLNMNKSQVIKHLTRPIFNHLNQWMI